MHKAQCTRAVEHPAYQYLHNWIGEMDQKNLIEIEQTVDMDKHDKRNQCSCETNFVADDNYKQKISFRTAGNTTDGENKNQLLWITNNNIKKQEISIRMWDELILDLS